MTRIGAQTLARARARLNTETARMSHHVFVGMPHGVAAMVSSASGAQRMLSSRPFRVNVDAYGLGLVDVLHISGLLSKVGAKGLAPPCAEEAAQAGVVMARW